jgi:hypothetical protein
LTWNWKSRKWETGQTHRPLAGAQLVTPPVVEQLQLREISWSRFAVSLIISLGLLVALVVLPHPW